MLMFKAKSRSWGTGTTRAPSNVEKPLAQHSVIPADLKVVGDLLSAGDIHVEGTIHGNITCRALTLTGQPLIEGSIKAETVRICGTFNGEVETKKASLIKTARVNGNIRCEIIEIEPGAWFEGHVSCLR
jgi:cytoskeletal protein CcmA (bactofilin family)